MILVLEKEDTGPGADGWTVSEGAKTKTADIRSRLLIDVVELGLLNASDMTASICEEGMDGVFATLVV